MFAKLLAKFPAINPFYRPTFLQLVAEEATRTAQEALDLDHAIKIRQYHKHMAEAKLKAINDWVTDNVNILPPQ